MKKIPIPLDTIYHAAGIFKRVAQHPLPLAKDSLIGITRTRLVERQLTCLFGELELSYQKKLWRLYPEDVEQLAIDLLKFDSKKDLIAWFRQNPPRKYRPPEI